MFKVLQLALVLVIAAVGPVATAAADDGTRITISSIDAASFPDVKVSASVVDASGRPVAGLGPNDLILFERGVERPADVEFTSRTAPIALALILDVSGSMAGRPLEDAKRAIASLVAALGAEDQAALITFNAAPRVAQALTPRKDALLAATNAAVAVGNTAIYDALAVGLDVLAAAPQPRRAAVLLTDGLDTASKSTKASAIAKASAVGLTLHVVALGADLDLATLSSLADATPGGQLREAPSSADLQGIYDALIQQIRTEYALTYRSALGVPAGAVVDVQLALRPGGVVRARADLQFAVPAGRGTVVVAATPAPVLTQAPVAPIVAALPADVPARFPSEVVGLLGAATVLTLLLWVAEIVARFPDRQRRRLERFVRRLTLTTAEHAKRRSLVQRVIVPTLRTASRPLLRITPLGLVASTRERLQHAGEPMGLGPVDFIGVRVGAGLIGGAIGLAIATFGGGEPFGVLVATAFGTFVGFLVPEQLLGLKARRRQSAIRKALPTSLDMLALGAHAGLSLDGAIAQVAQRWDTPLADEFRRVLVEFQMGRERREALRQLGIRTGMADVMRVASAVIQAENLGVPLARVLVEQASELRTRRRQRAEELANKAPVKMLFPMVLLIFPALFVVILGPAVPRILEIFTVY